MKRMKKRLTETADHYHQLGVRCMDELANTRLESGKMNKDCCEKLEKLVSYCVQNLRSVKLSSLASYLGPVFD